MGGKISNHLSPPKYQLRSVPVPRLSVSTGLQMGLLRSSFAFLGLAFFAHFVYDNLYTKLPVHVAGQNKEQFEAVRKAFLDNFKKGWEGDGAAVTVFHKGEKVVDLWGGYADKQAARKWKEDTLTITFSTTKAVAAVCIALLVDRGRLRYDDLVSKHWPGFAKNGKANVTVQMAISHMAGLAYLNVPITEKMAGDHNLMREILENEAPKWTPGTENGYHPYTYGWIVDQIIRHSDEKKRGIGQFLREEITGPNGIDYHIGLAARESHRVARISVPTTWQRISEMIHDHRIIVQFKALWKLLSDTPLSRAVNNPKWLQAVSKCTVNNPEHHGLEQAGALGIGNARSLATIFNLVVNEKILSRKLLNQLQTPYINKTDIVFGDKVAKGHGFLYQNLNRAGVTYFVGHTGHGCQQIVYDLKNRLVISYVTNGLKTGLYDMCRTYWSLQTTIYDIIEKIDEQ